MTRNEPPPYAAAPYGTAPYGTSPPGAPPYGAAPGHGLPPWPVPPHPAYWGWGAPQPGPWPYVRQRPGAVTAAAVLGFVTGGLTVLGSVLSIVATAAGDGDPPSAVMMLGLPCAVGMIAGGIRVLRRGRPLLLLRSALAAVAVLLVAFVAGAVTLDAGEVVGLTVFMVVALPLPIGTAVLAGQRRVREWAAAGRR